MGENRLIAPLIDARVDGDIVVPGGVYLWLPRDADLGRDRPTHCEIPAAVLDVSVVVPTRNEAPNVRPLVMRLLAVLPADTCEVIFVDDSDDATPSVIRQLIDEGFPVRLFHRLAAERRGGLGGAVELGMRAAAARVVVVMDGDLQHPPERVPALIEPLLAGHADISLASRYIRSGDPGGLDGRLRRASSLAARHATWSLFPHLRRVSDPCGGFFAISRELVGDVALRPDGYKILLELLVRTSWERPAEIPYAFGARSHERSKFTLAEVGRFGRHLHALRRHERTKVRPRRRLSWPCHAVFSAFLAVQAGLILDGNLKGAFIDEGIYITAGQRVLEGHGFSDGYLTWFAGHLLWPLLAGLAYQLGGLEAARLLAALLVTLAIWAASRATMNLVGRAAAPGSAAFLACSATYLALGHLAVYDAAAIALVGLGLWLCTEGVQRGRRSWLVGGAALLALAGVTKYPIAVFLVPAIAYVVAARRAARAVADVAVMSLTVGAVFLVAFLPAREQLAAFLDWRVLNNPSFGVTRAMIGAEAAAMLLPALLIVPFGIAASDRRVRAALFVVPALVFPIYHVIAGNSVGMHKHIAFGLLWAAPIAGAGLASLTRRSAWGRLMASVLLSSALILGFLHMRQLDAGWLDTTEGAQYLVDHVGPDDLVLASNKWPLLPLLRSSDAGVDVDQVWDAYQLEHDPTSPWVCEADWVVDEEGSIGWSPEFLAELYECGTFVVVQKSVDELTALGTTGRYVTWAAGLTVWRNQGAGT